MLQINNLKLKLKYTESDIFDCLYKLYGIDKDEVLDYSLLKRSIDARDKGDVHYLIALTASLKNEEKYCGVAGISEYQEMPYTFVMPKHYPKNQIVIVGFGPCGMFCGLVLARLGFKPIIIERGKDVEQRQRDIEHFIKTGELNTESNVQFGEGGAGTFSDGKLTTGVKSEYLRVILGELVAFGAPKEILYENKPHIGSDNLIKIVQNIRSEITRLGGQVLFSHCLKSVKFSDDKVKEAIVSTPTVLKSIPTESIVLCIGHSSRDTYEVLNNIGVKMAQKPFSIGVRIEHLQSEINKSQYGRFAADLPAADYKISEKIGGRGVYTFCNCPGGVVIPSASETFGAVTNGMSYYNRNCPNSNSALLVDVRTDDFESSDVLAGVEFQRKYERLAFAQGYKAKCQLVGDFLANKKSVAYRSVKPSYLRGVIMDEVETSLPLFASSSIRAALPLMDRKLKGFAHPDAVLTAVETRSSAPVRILRNDDYQANYSGLFPAGEGCGYAGGIISAALDGIKIAKKIADEYN